MEVTIIAGVAKNNVIGNANSIPWHISEDLQRFKKLTMNKPIIMGRKTYESIIAKLGKPLPGRKTIVLTSQNIETPADVETAADITAALRVAKKYGKEIFIGGGTQVYEAFKNVADTLELTKIDREFEGDTQFPEINWNEWEEKKRTEKETENGLAYSFVRYERRKE